MASGCDLAGPTEPPPTSGLDLCTRVRKVVDPLPLGNQVKAELSGTSGGSPVCRLSSHELEIARFPASADEGFLVAQDDEGHVGETVYGSSLHVTASPPALAETRRDGSFVEASGVAAASSRSCGS